MIIKNLSLLCAPFSPADRVSERQPTAANDASWRARTLAAAHARYAGRGTSALTQDLALARALAC